jgi:hypothetical protein
MNSNSAALTESHSVSGVAEYHCANDNSAVEKGQPADLKMAISKLENDLHALSAHLSEGILRFRRYSV